MIDLPGWADALLALTLVVIVIWLVGAATFTVADRLPHHKPEN